MLVVNLFAGPGAGKSTTRAGVFHRLKLMGFNVEEATEYAKDLTWDKRFNTLSCQPYVFGKQLYRLVRLNGQVDAVITDSPLLLGAIYAGKNEPRSLRQLIEDKFNEFDNLNFFIKRVKPYNPKGRNQTEEEAQYIDSEVKTYLFRRNVDYTVLDGNEEAAIIIANKVAERLSN